jgi:uncharacterized protein (TIGR03437 family)
MRKFTNWHALGLFVTLGLSSSLYSQTTLQLSAGSGVPSGTASLLLSINSPAGQEPASVQWTINYPPSAVAGLAVVAGSSSLNAGKTISCFGGTNFYNCIAEGVNSNIIANGTLATVSIALTPGVPMGITSIGLSNALGASPIAASIPVFTTAGSVNVTSAASLLSGLTCASNILAPGTITACTVALNSPAGAGGVTIQLSSSSTAISIPASVTVAAGSSSAVFQAIGSGGSSDQSGIISASFGNSSVSFGLSFSALPGVQSLQCSTATLLPGTSPTCSLTLTKAAPAGGSTVTIQNGVGPVLTVPASVTVPAGQTTASFQLMAGSITTSGSGNVTALLNGSTQAFAFTWAISSGVPTGGSSITASLTCASPSVAANSSDVCTVTLSAGAPAGGAMITLSSNNSLITLPPAVGISQGDTLVQFLANALSFTSAQTATITATWNSISTNVTLNLTSITQQTPSLFLVSCASQTLVPGAITTCTVALTGNVTAPASISLSSNNSAVIIPSSVTVAAGAFSASFPVTALGSFGALGTIGIATISAAWQGVTVSATLTSPASSQSPNIQASSAESNLGGRNLPPRPTSLKCAPGADSANGRIVCEVLLSAPMDDDAKLLRIVSSSSHVHAPPASGPRSGQNKFRFEVEADAQAGSESATLTVKSDTGEITEDLKTSITGSGDLSGREQSTDSGSANARVPAGSRSSNGRSFPSVRSIENGANSAATAACSPGSLAALRGSFLMAGSSAGSVMVNGKPAAVVGASDDRLEFVCPDLPAGTPLDLSVETTAGRSEAIHSQMRDVAPGIFAARMSSGKVALAVREGSSELASVSSPRYAARPAVAGDTLLVRATGIDCNSPVTAGRLQVQFGQTYASVVSVFPAAAPGQCEIAVIVPPGISSDAAPIRLETARTDRSVAASNTVFVAVEPQ